MQLDFKSIQIESRAAAHNTSIQNDKDYDNIRQTTLRSILRTSIFLEMFM